jgi:tetratricopeptide (TPR) repeat protein
MIHRSGSKGSTGKSNAGKGSAASLAWAWLLLMAAGAASATQSTPAPAKPDVAGAVAPGPAAGPARAALANKLRLVKLLLAQSAAVQRIPQSDNGPAKKKLAEAQALYAKAEAEAAAGHEKEAIQRLDESLRQIVSASALVPDVAHQAAQERSQNTALHESIRTFQLLHKNLSSRVAQGKKSQPAAGATDISRIDAMVDKADALSASGDHAQANGVLNSAYKSVVSALNKMLTAETFVYDLKFDSPAEEFQHELARNRGYEELIPIALAQSGKARATATLTEPAVQQSRKLRDAAQKQASAGDHQAAVKSLQDATGHLQRALRIAGVVVPQSPEAIMP